MRLEGILRFAALGMHQYHVWLVEKESRTDQYHHKALKDVRQLLLPVVLHLVALC